jgi:hypothetical protein
MQPSLVFAGLALATLMKSSEMGLGTAGRNRAVWLRDQAQTSLEASWNSQWIDMALAKAALVRSRMPSTIPISDIHHRSLLSMNLQRIPFTLRNVRDSHSSAWTTLFAPSGLPS